jgi:hypothetical protein
MARDKVFKKKPRRPSPPGKKAVTPVVPTQDQNVTQVSTFPALAVVDSDIKRLKKVLRDEGFPNNLISAIETRALRSGRRQTGIFKSNRDPRWRLIHDDPTHGTDPQYGSELDCKVILIILLLTTLEFRNAPHIVNPIINELSMRYLGRALRRNGYRDSLLLEYLDFNALRAEADAPTHGHSQFHIGHQDPTRVPKHAPINVAWRTLRSNLIQGNMTLRQARIYILKLIARYFELGELDII